MDGRAAIGILSKSVSVLTVWARDDRVYGVQNGGVQNGGVEVGGVEDGGPYLTASLAGTGFHPAAWRVGAQPGFPIGRRVRDMARIAEQGGLDAAWLGPPRFGAAAAATGEVDATRLDPLPLLGSLIAATRRIGLGAFWGVDGTEPFHVARVFATLDHLSYGRSAWIVGLPRDEADLARAHELVAVTRKLWDSWEDEGFLLDVPSGRFADPARVHPILHEGAHFAVRGPLNLPRPVQGNPPVVAGFPASEAGRRFAATVADVLLLDCDTAEDAAAQRAAIRVLRPDGELRVLVNVVAVLAGTEDAARGRRDALDAMVTPAMAAALRADGARRTLRFAGTPARLAALMRAWHADGVCDGFNLLPAVLPDDLAAAALPGRHAAGGTLRERLGLARPRSRYAT